MKNTIEAQFKTLTDLYIKSIDYLNVVKIFAKSESYTLESLREIFIEQSNLKYISIAKEAFFEFLETQHYVTGNAKVFFFTEEIVAYLNDSERTSKAKYYYLLKLAFIIAFYQRLSQRFDKKVFEITSLNDLKELNHYQYFRGQSNFEWRMSPSILRNLNMNIVLDDDYYFKLLNNAGLETKFNNLIKPTLGFSIETKYNKYAFIQHACSYSPLIDFTKQSIIATSFALSNVSNLNDFRNTDASIMCMRFNKEKKDNIITDKKDVRLFIKNELTLDIINFDYFVFGKRYELEKSDGTKKSICILSIDKLLDRMTPDYKVIDIPTNDRMLYQKGLFICFYNCLCFKDYIAYELCPDLYLSKAMIRKSRKRVILGDIYKNHREFDPEHLMDPYLHFKE